MKLPVWRRRCEEELEEEIQSHLQMAIRDRMERGESAEAAELAARREFGNVGLIKETTRGMWGWAEARLFFDDMRYGFRMLRKTPGWTAVMCAVLSLGIGLTTAVFSLAYGVLLRSLPYPDPERIVALNNNSSFALARGLRRVGVSSADWIDWRAQSKSFEEIALIRQGVNFNLTGGGPPERAQGARVSWNLPQVLGVRPMLGRMFTEEEASRDAKVAVLSYGFWDRRFARDPAIVGRKVQLNGETFDVIGVMPPNFQYPVRGVELLAPLFISPDEIESRMDFQSSSIGRLKYGVSLWQAQEEMSAIMRRLAEQYSPNRQRGVLVEPALESVAEQFRKTLYLLLTAVGCLLLIVCVNLGGLLIARASARTGEFTIRAALGAGAARLRRQALAETLPLSAAGGVGGMSLAWGLLRVLEQWLPPQLRGLEPIGLNGPAMALALALSALVVLLAGMLPARMASRIQLATTMRQDSRAGAGAIRNALVVAQVAVTLALVFAGGLLARSLVAVMRVNPGFSPEGVLTLSLQVTQAKYPSHPQVVDYYHRLAARVKTIPGVIEAAMVNTLPFSRGVHGGAQFEGKTVDEQVPASFSSVTPGYFSAMGIPLVRGRDFTEHDKASLPYVGIIDEQLAREAFGGANPLGKRFRFGVITDSTPWVEIVGVVGHIKAWSLETDPHPQVYWLGSRPRPEAAMTLYRSTLVIRTVGRPELYTSDVVEQIHKEDPDQPVYDVRSMQDWIDRSLLSRNLMTGLVTLFGGSSLLLSCLGLYGVVSYGAGLRLREFAIRTALGARANDIRRIVFANALRLWIWGAGVGLVLAWMAGRALKTQLYGVGSADAIALTVAPALLLVTALLAGLGPARRAGRVDPAVTLRSD